jgi:hypothetical protein
MSKFNPAEFYKKYMEERMKLYTPSFEYTPSLFTHIIMEPMIIEEVPKGYDESTEWLDVCSCMKPDFEIVFVGV